MIFVNKLFSRYVEIFQLAWKGFDAYRYQILLLASLGFVGGLLESIGINAVIPLLSFIIGTGPTADLDFISEAIRSVFLFLHIPFKFRYLLVFIILLFILKAVVTFVITYITVKITANYESEVRSKLFRETLKAKWGYLVSQKLGHLETILMTNVKSSSEMLERVSQMLVLFSGLLVYMLVAINISPKITIFALLLGGVLFFVLKPVLRAARGTAHGILNATKEVAHYVNENVVGIKTVKTTSSENPVSEIGTNLFETLRVLRIRSTLLRSINNVLVQPISLIFISVIFAFSFKTEGFVFSAFIAIVYLIQRIFTHFQTLQTNLHRMNESAPYLRNVVEYEEELRKNIEPRVGKSGGFEFRNTLSFSNVNFSYENNGPVLKDISFKIEKGDMIGIIGPSGSGKTTVVDLVLRMFVPDRGEIEVDNKNIEEIDVDEWRRNIGYVSQDMFLINDTIENNIKFYDDSISNEDIREAAKKAHILDFIEGTENKFQTNIGERGVRLSFGQRQRIVLARVLARKPELLVLDEATSALDNESEEQIQKAIEGLRGNITTLIVAHRLSTIENATKLIVLKDGEILEEGDPKKLIKDEGSYFYKVHNIRK
ncbi:MAG: ABC transporter ATP-binding protein [Candidatus Pacebacteria bacterium]|jgi:ABC-type multidrug transport system fused ATPase/permease subunit|nr:hypothetical protein [bacterium]MDP6527894.1 ABC transporter ATP-binding protein [Candidatus Paceibacterota bacterium]MDP6659704.1 ABC transporter ATP-binding protein [Candidatus Paceibacterota bacterium]|tara:strand:- start:23021 stop:24823 length:1803 start_codon:yes stop_codon:yes gene_type:complete